VAITRVFDIAQRSLLSSREAIDITSKNISNAKTEGYKRRRIETSHLIGFGSASGDSSVENASRIYNRFVENQLMREQQNLGKYDTTESILRNIEAIFGEPEEMGLNNVMSEFWAAWNDLSNDPESQSARIVVRDKGEMLASTFQRLYGNLRDIQQQIGLEINEKVDMVNQILRQIYSVNQQISANSTSDLLDQRDLLINDLSQLVDVKVREYPNDEIILSLGGQILLSENYLSQINTDVTYSNGFSDYTFRLDKSTSPLSINSGIMRGLIAINNEYIPDYVNRLNTLASTIANRVNAIHSSGYNLDGETGINFFESNITGAGDIALNVDVSFDASLIAASRTAVSGDGSIALEIADIQFEKLIQKDTIGNYYNTLVGKVGSQVQEASFMKSSQEKVVANLLNQRDAISGVSLDEEMTRLIEYEKSYQAASRLVQVANDMVDTLLSMI